MADDETLSALRSAVGERSEKLLTPALIVDLDAVEHNVEAAIAKVGNKARWRPHVKTVKQSRIIKQLISSGITHLKCATLDELALICDAAERVHPEGEIDAMLAYPLSRPGVGAVLNLLGFYEGAHVHLLADSPDHLGALAAWIDELGGSRRLSVMLDVNVGMNRTGTPVRKWISAAKQVAATRSPKLSGIHGYEGHLGWERREEANAGYVELLDLATSLPKKATRFIVTSGTHSFAHALAHKGLAAGGWTHQVSMGTIVLSDLRSAPAVEALGLKQAAFVATRVVSRPGEDRITFDAGSKAIAPDRPAPSCRVLGRPNLRPLTPSEEHMPVAIPEGDRPRWGELCFLVPDHVCTTVNLHRRVVYVRGSRWIGLGQVEAMSRTIEPDAPRP